MQTATLPVFETHHAPADVRILVAADDMPARLTLEAVLHKSGYSVDSAARLTLEAVLHKAAIQLIPRPLPEAMDKIEDEQYALILCNLRQESPDACRKVIGLAQRQEYKPATAYLTTSSDGESNDPESDDLLVETIEVPALLTEIADLIASRAAYRAQRATRRQTA